MRPLPPVVVGGLRRVGTGDKHTIACDQDPPPQLVVGGWRGGGVQRV